MSFFFFLLGLVLASEKDPTVHTKFGSLKGKRIDSYGGQQGIAFLGIPLAAPPIGPLRFKAPIDPEPWEGILEATEYRDACLSDPVRTYKRAEGGPVSEDCLYINVFSSKKCLQNMDCSVMAVIHGGVFKFEAPSIFRPEVIVNNFANEERNVIVVTLPYRLGTAGFFQLAPQMNSSTDTNVGMKDIIFGLNFIQREISSFGGNPKKVTLMGHSAGATAANMLTFLPSTKDLFEQLIVMSGPTTGGDSSHSVNTEHSRAVSKLFGCASEEERFEKKERVEEIIECVRSKDGREILEAQETMKKRVEETTSIWIDGPEGLMPDYMKELRKKPRKLNVLIGTVTSEFRDAKSAQDAFGRANMTRLTEICELIGYMKNYERPERFVNACLQFYGRPNITEMLDDHYLFYTNVGQMGDLFSKKGGNVFVYSYEYGGAGKAFEKYSQESKGGPSHSEDYIYIFGLHRNDSAMKAKDFQIERIYSGIVANFVNTGNPSYFGYNWNKWTKEKRDYFVIDFDENLRLPGMKEGYYKEASEFWEEIAAKEGGEWIPKEEFPLGIDIFEARQAISSYETVWINSSAMSEKTFEVGVEMSKRYKKYISQLKEQRKSSLTQKKNPFIHPKATVISSSSSIPETVEGDGINWLTIILAVSVVLLVVYIAIMKLAEYRKRKDYNLIIN